MNAAEHDIKHIPASASLPGLVQLYIQCEYDQEFQICVDGPAVPTNHDVRATFTVDGNEIEGFIHQPGKTTVCRVSHHEFDGAFYDRTLKFQRITAVEDGPRPGVAEVGALGTILVDLEAGTLSSKRKALPATIENNIDTMDEKLILKGGLTGLGDVAGTTSKTETWTFTHIVPTPTYQLRFTYATRELLILQGVLDDPNGALQPAAHKRKARHGGLSASAKRSRASDIALTMAQQRLKRAIDKLNNGGENNCSDDDEVIDLTQEDEEI
ncbi:uncharacterized protein EHS24_003260 [Apiotrichum porosum]|uniref:DUF7918 domain-containing protein n=1 Tax=Apiotrichum porosum TaxID=105984 RepID=A0A427XG17_9TREE|nr:uncharacterized protein EHS24_003260 [Apiotrichum porosum]RSH77693.1 hypothetical protein EHS24_003260 [Apiotrichum porosum]